MTFGLKAAMGHSLEIRRLEIMSRINSVNPYIAQTYFDLLCDLFQEISIIIVERKIVCIDPEHRAELPDFIALAELVTIMCEKFRVSQMKDYWPVSGPCAIYILPVMQGDMTK